jgi:alkylhydroperoxidase family enzyme
VRGLVATAVSEINRCDYSRCFVMVLGRRTGLTDAELDAARRMEASDPRTAVLLRVAGQLVRERRKVSPRDVEALRAAGVSDEEIIELVALVATNIFRDYLSLVAGIELDAPLIPRKLA